MIMMLAAISYTGTIDRVENDFAHIVFTFESSERISTDIPVALIPCEVAEGDVLYVRKTSESTEIRCTEFVQPAPTVDVQINPTTGEMQYIIKDIPLEQESNMINFLSSKNVSLGCAVINVVIAGVSLADGSWGWAAFSAALAGYCYSNYLKA